MHACISASHSRLSAAPRLNLTCSRAVPELSSLEAEYPRGRVMVLVASSSPLFVVGIPLSCSISFPLWRSNRRRDFRRWRMAITATRLHGEVGEICIALKRSDYYNKSKIARYSQQKCQRQRPWTCRLCGAGEGLGRKRSIRFMGTKVKIRYNALLSSPSRSHVEPAAPGHVIMNMPRLPQITCHRRLT